MNSIPLSAFELEIDENGYNEISRNIAWVQNLTQMQRQNILERANKELPIDIESRVRKLIIDMANDRAVYKVAELKYHKGPPEGQGLFITALADYLLREKSSMNLSFQSANLR